MDKNRILDRIQCHISLLYILACSLHNRNDSILRSTNVSYIKKAFLISALISVGVIFFAFNPEENPIFPKCPFLVLTGLKCPGCGSQRAIHSMLHLDFAAAFKYNALLVAMLPIIVIYIYSEVRRKKDPERYAKLNKVTYMLIIFATFILWWILRNIFDL